MQPIRDFLNFLLDKAGRSASVDANGQPVFTSLPNPLDDTPKGWEQQAIAWNRDIIRHGVIRSITAPLEFFKDAAKIVRWMYYNGGVQAFYRFLMQKRNNNNRHEDIYQGLLNFVTFSDTGLPGSVTIEVIEGGLHELVKARESQAYEFPVSDRPQKLYLDGIILEGSADYLPTNGDAIDLDELSGNHLVALSLPASDFGSYATGPAEVPRIKLVDYLPNTLFNSGGAPFFIPNTPGEVEFEVDMWVQIRCAQVIDAGANFVLVVRPLVGNTNAPAPPPLEIYRTVGAVATFGAGVGALNTVKDHHIVFSGTMSGLVPGITLWLQAGLNSIGTQADATSYDYLALPGVTSVINIKFKSRGAGTIINTQRPYLLGTKLVQAMTENDPYYSFLSPLLTGAAIDVLVTSGDAIRGIESAVIKTSWKDFYDSFNTPFEIGMGIEGNTLVLDDMGRFYANSDMIDLTLLLEIEPDEENVSVAAFNLKPAIDLLYSSVLVGWPNQNYDDLNGRFEFNTSHQYTTPLTKVNKELERVSVYRADSYGVEFTRLKGNNTTDSSSDNDVFMIKCQPVDFLGEVTFTNDNSFSVSGWRIAPGATIGFTGTAFNDGFFTVSAVDPVTGAATVEEATIAEVAAGVAMSSDIALVDRSLNAGIVGVPESAFNVSLSPSRCLRAHGRTLRSFLKHQEAQYIKFSKSDKNAVVVADGISERADILVNTLAQPLFLAELMEFQTKVPFNMMDVVGANPYGRVRFPWLGNEFTGYPLQLSQQPAFEETQTFTLLSTNINNFSKLIV